MSNLPQIFMRLPDTTKLPPFALPEGFALHTHADKHEKAWEEIVEAAFGMHYSFDATIRNGGGYRPEYVMYISKDGTDIATVTAVEKEDFPGEGWFRMVATHPKARGMGAGRLAANAALHSLAARGYKSVVLSTDDERIPAIKLYLSLGFEPIYTHESHEARWAEIMKKINK